MKKLLKNKYVKYLVITVLITFLLEIFLFNNWAVRSWFSTEENAKYEVGSGFLCTENNYCMPSENENLYLTINDIEPSWDNLYLDLKADIAVQRLKIFYKTSESDKYQEYATWEINPHVKKTKYLNLNKMGDVTDIRLLFTNFYNYTLTEVSANKDYSLEFNYYRIILIGILVFCALIYKPKFNFANDSFALYKIISAVIISLLLIIGAIYFSKNEYGNYDFKYGNPESQYYHLAESLAQNEVKLNLDVSDKLKALDNPYDTTVRDSLMIRNLDYYWDYAYYNEAYYSYFGIVPCLMSHLPYYLVTGNHLPNGIALLCSLAILAIGTFVLLHEIFQKYFNKLPKFWYVFLSVFVLLTSGLAIVVRKPNFYNIPIVLGVGLTMLGLAFWFRSTKIKKLDRNLLFWGSLCMALVAGCRPQLLLVSFLAFWIFKDYLRDYKKYYKEFLAFATPYVVVAIFMMIYNYVRFDSILDFGAAYNLTTNDMTSREFSWQRLLISTFVYLFEPGKIEGTFPFIQLYNLNSLFDIDVLIIWEPLVGGLYFLNFISLLGLFPFVFKKKFKDKKVWILTFVLNILGLLIMLADAHVAGILPRYYNDFAFLLNLSAVLVMFALLDSTKSKSLRVVFIVLVIIALILNILLALDPTSWA